MQLTTADMSRQDISLQEWMDQHRLNDRALAEQVGRDRSQISRIRRGGRASPATAEALAAVTGLPAASFIFGRKAATAIVEVQA